MADPIWRKGPHADAICALRESITKRERRADEITRTLASVEKLWGPADVERLTGEDGDNGEKWVNEEREAAEAMRATVQLLMSLPVEVPE